jgi:hypothetical protein
MTITSHEGRSCSVLHFPQTAPFLLGTRSAAVPRIDADEHSSRPNAKQGSF